MMRSACLALLIAQLVGCAASGAGTTHLTSATATHEEAASLLLSREIVDRCPALRSVAPPKGQEDDAWLYGMKALGNCMRRGELRGAKVTLTGGDDAQEVVAYILGKLGIDEARVSRTKGPASKLECRVDLPQGELMPQRPGGLQGTSEEPGTLQFVVARRRVVAMVFAEDLDLE